MIKTLTDILRAIRELPVEAFASFDTVHEVREAVQARRSEWTQSPQHDKQQQQEATKLAHRQDLDTARYGRRDRWARNNVKEGMFVKVTGARDGCGIREVISVASDGIACRQWRPASGRWRHRDTRVETFPSGSFLPDNQMTTHEFKKVAGHFTIDVNGRYTLHKIA